MTRPGVRRALATKFVVVGIVGFAVQLAVLALLTTVIRWSWLPATLVAVEAAIVHNFLWHCRWTWRDRLSRMERDGVSMERDGSSRAQPLTIFTRFARFNLSTAITSLVGNVALMAILVSLIGLPVVLANAVAVVIISVANFWLADRWSFRASPAVLASAVVCGLSLSMARPALAAPSAAAVASWDRYVVQVESATATATTASDARRSDAIVADGRSIDVTGGTISDWRASVFIPDITLDQLLRRLKDPGTPPPQEDVVAARVLSRRGDSLNVYIRLVRRAIVTATYDTEHEMTFERRTDTVAAARSIATRIDPVDGGDHGFLWRLNSYWRYEQVDGGVQVTLRSLTLSRDVPRLIRPVAGPLITRIARESIVRTLTALREYLSRSAIHHLARSPTE